MEEKLKEKRTSKLSRISITSRLSTLSQPLMSEFDEYTKLNYEDYLKYFLFEDPLLYQVINDFKDNLI